MWELAQNNGPADLVTTTCSIATGLTARSGGLSWEKTRWNAIRLKCGVELCFENNSNDVAVFSSIAHPSSDIFSNAIKLYSPTGSRTRLLTALDGISLFFLHIVSYDTSRKGTSNTIFYFMLWSFIMWLFIEMVGDERWHATRWFTVE